MNSRKDLSPALADLESRLGAAAGKHYWRTLDELANTRAFQELIGREFPEQAAALPSALSRRQFLGLMGASLALAGLSGCSVRPAPSATLVPYVEAPEELIPGKPLFYATAMTLGGCGVGVLVESHMGRPTKIEGNPEHPASLGATDIYGQASVLTLYDPDRSQTVTHLGKTRTWEDALAVLREALDKQRPRRGAGLRVLTETVVSPTLGQQLDDLLKAFPEARWHQYEPIARDAAARGARMAFGKQVNTLYDFQKADVVLALDADFLTSGPGHLRHVADFMSRRRIRNGADSAKQARMNRLYVVETAVTCTGAKADHRLALPAHAIEGLARAVAGRAGVPVGAGQTAPGPQEKWIAALVEDLKDHAGRCLVVAGDRQPDTVHLLAHVLNSKDYLGNVGQTVFHTDPIEARPGDTVQSLNELVEDMKQGRVEVLVILGGNPVFNAPADFHFTEHLQKVPLRLHLSLFQDETSRQCHWHLPEAHYLEAWSDTRAFDGTASIVQPLIEPLYHGRSAHEVVAALAGQLHVPGYELVRGYWRRHWQGQKSAGDFDSLWQTAVHDGIIAGTTLPRRSEPLQAGWNDRLNAAGGATATGAGDGYELVFEPDPAIYDGRFANNGWLQELPRPITKLTWDNAALMSPATAQQLGVGLGAYAHGGEHGGYHVPIIELEVQGHAVRAPIWIMPGHADRSITVSLGHGRDSAGRVGGNSGNKVGFNAYALRTSKQPWMAPGLKIQKTGDTYLLACTQEHHLMENRAIVRTASLQHFGDKPRFAQELEEEHLETEAARGRKPLSLYKEYEYPAHKWGMVIDLTTCIGCNACVVACQSENNIPVVGKEQVAAGREMHWLRVDRYISGPYHDPTEFHFQPLPCMHCENAPCEYVCPVEATVHSADGLNEMVYQRCVGTRFCSNNCPYKVRRFNFFHYADYDTPSVRLQYNPDVTVRSRGVMEKCSYCVQRIRHAEIDSQKEGRAIRDGEILTACQAACPAEAIVFGDINDGRSKVKQWKGSPLHYGLLEDLNTVPRTTYLAALRNPNPKLEAT